MTSHLCPHPVASVPFLFFPLQQNSLKELSVFAISHFSPLLLQIISNQAFNLFHFIEVALPKVTNEPPWCQIKWSILSPHPASHFINIPNRNLLLEILSPCGFQDNILSLANPLAATTQSPFLVSPLIPNLYHCIAPEFRPWTIYLLDNLP